MAAEQEVEADENEDDIIDAHLEDLGFEAPEKWLAVAWYYSGFLFSVSKLFQEMSKAWGIQDDVPARDLGGNRFLMEFPSKKEVSSVEALHRFHPKKIKRAGEKNTQFRVASAKGVTSAIADRISNLANNTMEVDEQAVEIKEEVLTEGEAKGGKATKRSKVDPSLSIGQDTSSIDPKGKRPMVMTMQKKACYERQMKGHPKWEAPPDGWVKINANGGFDTSTWNAGIGMIIRDSNGRALLCSWRVIFNARDAKEIEAMAAREGLLLAAEWVHEKAILETDCASVIQAFKQVNNLRSSLTFVSREGVEASRRLPHFSLSLAKREQNKAAHELAQLAKRTKHTIVWHLHVPECVEQLIAEDCNTSLE
ncbi:hypothetical protein PR202_gb19007 [Eleusine coracana subsp. coracana]|uniref:RNase H type-1 domain-containing protein n=1 Tax=Eleusine coracana subsp. coracana TaxID=191504 RepID=A0AAV5F6X2_ELECO|nr:hypothetical protein PR202_gb19007 [Eleusine coracana subsp. coracana]